MPAPYFTPTTDGVQTFPLTSGVTTNTVVKSGSGTLGRILVTSANGAAAINIYDATSPSSGAITGTIIGVVPASATVGTVITLGMPFTLGCIIGGAATNGALTISYY